MGKKKKARVVVVLDTNVILSAVLFGGSVSQIRKLWKIGRILPLFSRDTFQELQRTLQYPKFALTPSEIQVLLEEEILPFFSVVDDTPAITGICKDPDDDKFISCAVSGLAQFLVTGDKDLYGSRNTELSI